VTFKLKAELGMCCGGRMEVWMEPVPATPRLLLCGAGHVGKATAELATAVGLRVEVLDHRPEWNTAERFSVTRHTGEPVATLTALASEGDLVVITTHDHDLDKRLVDAALRTEASYVGMIGSHRKASSTRRFLALAGHAEAAIERVHMPIGLDIFAETPEEIGLAIVAELVRHRREPASRKTTRGAAVGSRRDEEPA
jgi:xanthine dehydrogenase accessory factor